LSSTPDWQHALLASSTPLAHDSEAIAQIDPPYPALQTHLPSVHAPLPLQPLF